MNVFLMYPDKEFDPEQKFNIYQKDLVIDLQLDPLFDLMADHSDTMRKVISIALLSPLKNEKEILYRQEILKDVLKYPDIVRKLYELSKKAREAEKKSRFGFFTHHLGGILYSGIELMRMLIGFLKEIRKVVIEEGEGFSSKGFLRFFSMIKEELTDEYFNKIETHLRFLEFKKGILISARLGKGNKGRDYTLCKPCIETNSLFNRIFSKRASGYTFVIDERDESGERAVSEIRERGINNVTNALAQSVEHILSFFDTLKIELAFYIGALNLYRYLKDKGAYISFPSPFPVEDIRYNIEGLYDPSLAITLKKKVVENSLISEGKRLFIITGANQGGKTTFLRSIGIAYLMMQAGLFVCAKGLSIPLSSGIYTHFRREEDRKMESGKLDEELRRMNMIIDNIGPGAVVLSNESFSSTNEKEGSEIATQIVSALTDSGINVFFVTHMYKFAYDFYTKREKDVISLHAERKRGGVRTYKIIEGPPEKTGYTKDLLDDGL